MDQSVTAKDDEYKKDMEVSKSKSDEAAKAMNIMMEAEYDVNAAAEEAARLRPRGGKANVFFENIRLLGRSYHILKGNILTRSSSDLGFGSSVFLNEYDSDNLRPKWLKLTDLESCSTSIYQRRTDDKQAYSDQVEASASVSASYWGVTGSASAEFKKATSKSESSHSMTMSKETKCLWASGRMETGKVRYDFEFLKDVDDLPDTYVKDDAQSEGAYSAFITKYGTHVLLGIDLGSKYELKLSTTMTSNSEQESASKKLSAAVEGWGASVEASSADANSKSESKSEENISREMYSSGQAVFSDSPKDYGVWAESFRLGASVPVSYSNLLPIVEVIPAHWGPKRAQLAVALQQECKKLSPLGAMCSIDEGKVAYKIVHNYEQIAQVTLPTDKSNPKPSFPTNKNADKKEDPRSYPHVKTLTFWQPIVDSDQWLSLGHIVTESNAPPVMGTIVVKNSFPLVKPASDQLRVATDSWDVTNSTHKNHKQVVSFWSLEAGDEYVCPGHIVLLGASPDVGKAFTDRRKKFGCVKTSVLSKSENLASIRYGQLNSFPILTSSDSESSSRQRSLQELEYFKFIPDCDKKALNDEAKCKVYQDFRALSAENIFMSTENIHQQEQYVDPKLKDMSSSGPKFKNTFELKKWMMTEVYADQLGFTFDSQTPYEWPPPQDPVPVQDPALTSAATWVPLWCTGIASLTLIILALLACAIWFIWFRPAARSKRNKFGTKLDIPSPATEAEARKEKESALVWSSPAGFVKRS